METNTNLSGKGKNLLFFIGNGFNINLGLPTAYTDFLKWYGEQPIGDVPSANTIERIKEELKKDLAPDGNKLWADMEKYLGERLTDELLVNEAPEDSIHVKEDIDAHLKTYLHEVNGKFSYHPYQTAVLLQDIVRMKIRLGMYDNPTDEVFFAHFNDTLRFVDFNYTDTLDKIVGKWGEVLHIHGCIDNLILGVDAERQIPGDNYADETELIKRYVKQENVDTKNKEKWMNWIKEADYICFFGLSFGITDRTYWKKVIGSKKPLVIFEFNPQHNVEKILQKTLQRVTPTQKIEGRTIWIPTGSIGDFWSALNPSMNLITGRDKAIAEDKNLKFRVRDVEFEMVYVEGGTFLMGAQSDNPNEENYDSDAKIDEKPVHSVTLNDFYMGKFEVTQALWQAVMGITISQQRNETDKTWPLKGEGVNYPMYFINWNECQTFITKLNEMCVWQLNGKRFSLPTEAEWEYAARGGNKNHGYKFSGSNNIHDVAWYAFNSIGKIHEIGTKLPNELGLYDMSGNVWEWCQDGYDSSYSNGSHTDPIGPSTGLNFVYRGGGWSSNARGCCVSYRGYGKPHYRRDFLGFRLSLH